MSATKRIGLLVGRETSFPDALVAEVARIARESGRDVVCEYAAFDLPSAEDRVPYDVLLDRISHEIVCYQPWLKLAVLRGTKVVNNPFFRIADDKFFNAGLARDLGLAVPKTRLLPQKSYPADVNDASLARNMRWVDWERLERELGYPMFVKPHWGGGWRDVSRVTNRAELYAAYDRSGEKAMIVQEAIAFTQYVRCIVLGKEHVRPALWDPRLSHFERYTRAHETMAPLSKELEARCIYDARTITRALGYDMNTVELAIRDGVPYAIDYMNSAPDLDVSSLGPDHFPWAVTTMAQHLVALAFDASGAPAPRWDTLLRAAP